MYTNNPKMPKIRKEAVNLVKYRGWSTRKVARHLGFTQSAIVKWCAKDPTGGWRDIPTESSRPHHHPKELREGVAKRIIRIREKTKRTSEVVHQILLEKGISVSLNSVRRTIDRAGLMKKRSPWKRYHPPVARPKPEKPGDLLQIDTIHRMIDEKKRLYIFVLLDVHSRWVYAKAYASMNGATSVAFVAEAEKVAPFIFDMLQSDHGPEFGSWFVSQIKKKHRYTRIGKPNDNAHIERFNRTLQEEYLDHLPNDVVAINGTMKQYLRYYNQERMHLGISLKTPMQIIQNRFQAIG
jgi:transposase InsO family protein